ncbi:TetR/AcrR family transcriptional regulator [Clostridium baratii]|uniref:TetR/AcrR family transcriptional regulator n=1 Tax=Clostridium baratii TaxID=1561 RepID=UPI001CAE37D8|nr:TetR/AcrR family transcriptional regulator [Clostridium baratii]MBS6041547.1 TetR/AcrR family transcriptional regulator [Clostridium baratii]MDU1855578.1 TetR/AcrR family transcriptional regulator [Clostridium baratii]STB00505.1 transcriptional regulator [Clostridium baratii]
MGNKIDTREKILMTASQMFFSNGYHATGLNAILKKSESPKGSLYYYFPNGKEELALEAIKVVKESIKEEIKEKLYSCNNPIEGIQKVILNVADIVGRDEIEKGTTVSLLALEASQTNEILRKACVETFRTWENLYEDRLLELNIEKEDAIEVSRMIQIMIEGAIIMSLTKKDNSSLILVKDNITSIINKYIK